MKAWSPSKPPFFAGKHTTVQYFTIILVHVKIRPVWNLSKHENDRRGFALSFANFGLGCEINSLQNGTLLTGLKECKKLHRGHSPLAWTFYNIYSYRQDGMCIKSYIKALCSLCHFDSRTPSDKQMIWVLLFCQSTYKSARKRENEGSACARDSPLKSPLFSDISSL